MPHWLPACNVPSSYDPHLQSLALHRDDAVHGRGANARRMPQSLHCRGIHAHGTSSAIACAIDHHKALANAISVHAIRTRAERALAASLLGLLPPPLAPLARERATKAANHPAAPARAEKLLEGGEGDGLEPLLLLQQLALCDKRLYMPRRRRTQAAAPESRAIAPPAALPWVTAAFKGRVAGSDDRWRYLPHAQGRP
jgi:hypothetical protein